MLRSILILLLAMFSIQYGASLAKTLFPALGPWGTTFLRVLFSASVLLILARPWKVRLERSMWKSIALYGFSLGSMNLLFYLSLQKIPLGVAVTLEFVGPLGVALLWSRNKSDFLWIALAAAGIFLLLPYDMSAPGSLDPLGVFLALAAGVFWGLYIIFGRQASAHGAGLVITAWGMCFAALAVLPWGFLFNFKSAMQVSLWPLALAVALLSSTIPYSLEMQALKKIPVKTFGIFMSLEPAIAILVGALFLKEYLEWYHGVAVGCVMLASAGSATFSAPADEQKPT